MDRVTLYVVCNDRVTLDVDVYLLSTVTRCVFFPSVWFSVNGQLCLWTIRDRGIRFAVSSFSLLNFKCSMNILKHLKLT